MFVPGLARERKGDPGTFYWTPGATPHICFNALEKRLEGRGGGRRKGCDKQKYNKDMLFEDVCVTVKAGGCLRGFATHSTSK